jgi:hypothetical protein
MDPNIYSLDPFWVEDADIEMLETALMSTYMQLKNLCEQALEKIRSSVIGAITNKEEITPSNYPVHTHFGVD